MPTPIDFEAVFARSPNPYMLLDGDLRYVAANDAYLRVTSSRREDLLGRFVLDAFPHDPSDPGNQNARQLLASFERVLATGEPDVLALIAYRVPQETEAGRIDEERFWSATHTPLLDAEGRVAYILQHTVDVTELERLRRSAQQATPPEQVLAGVLFRANEVQATNQSLETERSHLRRLFEQAPGFVCVLRGPDHVFEIANRAYRQLIGHRDAIGKPLRDAIPEIAGQGFLELLDRVRASGEPFVGRGMRAMLQREPQGPVEEAVLDFVYQPIVDADGRVSGIFVQGNDITAQARLEEERERLASLVEQSNEFIAVANLEGTAEYVNAAGRRLMGLTPEQVTTTKVIDYFFPEDRAFVAETILPTAAREGRWDGDMRFRHFVTGEPIPVSYNVFAVRDPAGVLRGYGTVTHDLTAQKRFEAEKASLARLEQEARADADAAERRQRFLAESIPQHVWTANGAGEIEFVNRRCIEYFGAPADALLGRGAFALLHPEDRPAADERWRRSLETGEIFDGHWRLRRGDGAWRWHLVRALPLRDGAGAITRWFGTNTDVDETWQARNALAERSRFEQQLIGIVSHDLRNPLTNIMLVAQSMLRRPDADHATMRAIARIESNAERMTRMIRDLLDFTKVRRGGGLELEVRPANLNRIAEQAVDDLRLVHPTRRIIFDAHAAGEGAWDEDRIAQVVTNLLTNAVKYSPTTAPVRVYTGGDDGEVLLEVHNAGEPIPQERLAGIFEPMQRATSVIDKSTRSVGLGLYIVDQIVRAHGGEVRVASSVEEGTTFRVRLPRRSVSPGSSTARTPAGSLPP